MTSNFESGARWELHLRMFQEILWQRKRNSRGEGEFPSLNKDKLKEELKAAGIQIPKILN